MTVEDAFLSGSVPEPERWYLSDLSYVLNAEDMQQITADIRSGQSHRGPFYLEIHVTDRCNSDCYFCNQRWLKHSPKELDLAHFTQIITGLTNVGLRAVRFSGGGEPTVHPHIKEMLDFIYESGLILARFDTNGILLTRDISDRLVKCHVKSLHISLQAPTRQSWAQVTKRRPSEFDDVLQNIRDFLEIDKHKKTSVYISFSIDEPTFDEVGSMVRLCENLDVRYRIHDLNAYTYSDHFHAVCLPILKDNIAAIITPGNKHSFRFSNLPSLKSFVETYFPASKQVTANRASPACLAPWVGLLVRANGNVYLCCALSEERHIIGNVFAQDPIDIWYGNTLARVRWEAKDLYFPHLNDGIMSAEQDCYRYLPKLYCRDCPVKQGMFSNPVLDKMLQDQSSRHLIEASRAAARLSQRR